MREKRKMTRFPLLRFTTHNISLLNYLTDCTVCEGIQVDQCYLTDIQLILSRVVVYLVPLPPIESWQEELSRGRPRGGMISWGIHASFNYYILRSGSEIIPPLVYASKYDPAQLYHPSYQKVFARASSIQGTMCDPHHAMQK